MPDVITLLDVEPVSVEEAKLAARVDTDALDEEVLALITAAREQAEHITGRCYRRQVRRFGLMDWPATTEALAVHRASTCAVRYWTGSAWSEDLSTSVYVYGPGGIGLNGTVLAPALGTSWPVLVDRPVGPRVQIDLTAGPADVSTVPECVKRYIKASVSAWIRTPEALAGGSLTPHALFERLLDSQRLYQF